MIGVIIVFGIIGYVIFGLPFTSAILYISKELYKNRGH